MVLHPPVFLNSGPWTWMEMASWTSRRTWWPWTWWTPRHQRRNWSGPSRCKGGHLITHLLMTRPVRTTNLGRFSHLDVYLAQNFPPFFYENFCPNHGRGLGENTFYSTHSRCLHTHRALHILQMWRSFWCSTKHCSALHAGPLLQGWDQAGTPSLFCRTDSSWQVFSISAEKILSV